MNTTQIFAGSALCFLIAFSPEARATTEPPPAYDARAVAMGSTAVAHVHSGAAVYHNPAALHEVAQFTATLALAANRVGQTAPLLPDGSSVESDAATTPLFLLGAAYRLNDRFILGVGAYATGGFGAEYELPMLRLRTSLGALEISPTLTFSVTDQLAFALGYRVTHMIQEIQGPGAQPGTSMDVELSGTNFTGLSASAYYRPTAALKLGLAYRSKVSTDLEGDARVGPMKLDSASEFSFPHAFRIGGALEVLKGELLVTAEARYLMHKEANESLRLEVGGVEQRQPLDWGDSMSVALGGEYVVAAMVPLRAGYMATLSATADDRPGPFFPPPGILHSIHAGAGVHLPNVDLDLGGYYSWASETVRAPAVAVAPGEYAMDVMVLCLSATYRR